MKFNPKSENPTELLYTFKAMLRANKNHAAKGGKEFYYDYEIEAIQERILKMMGE